MPFIRAAFRYVTDSGHVQRIGAGNYDWLPQAALEEAQRQGVLGQEGERAEPERKSLGDAPQNKARRRAPRNKRRSRA